MFKVGDKVVCIDISNLSNEFKNININEIYTIEYIDELDYMDSNYLSLKNIYFKYLSHRFKLLLEVRKEKIKNIINE